MKAMVFAAGYGSRLGKLTKNKPKCLMEAGGKTLLRHVLERLKGAGVSEVAINLYYLGEQIVEYLEAHESFGLSVTLFREDSLLGTGGGLQNAAHFFEGESAFVVYNSDIYSDIDIKKVIELHKKNRAVASLCVMERETTRPLLFDRNNLLCGWENTKEGTGEIFGNALDHTKLAFSGVQVLSAKIFDYMNNKLPFSTISAFLAAAKEEEIVQAVRIDDSYWIDVGTPEKLQELQMLLSPSESLQ
jgi:N-acetyl-alpha-D-muramate 1-phosphate uridylyltransferase